MFSWPDDGCFDTPSFFGMGKDNSAARIAANTHL
jgi:hypothetical protein